MAKTDTQKTGYKRPESREGKVNMALWVSPELRKEAKLAALHADETLESFCVEAIKQRIERERSRRSI